MKTACISDFLTREQIIACMAASHNGAKSIQAVIEPHIAEINQKLGQENDSLYLAYAIQYALQQFQGHGYAS